MEKEEDRADSEDDDVVGGGGCHDLLVKRLSIAEMGGKCRLSLLATYSAKRRHWNKVYVMVILYL